MTSQTEYSPGGGAKEQNQRGRGSAFARRGFSFYIVSYSSRLRRDCTKKCRLANVLLEVGGGFPALLFTSGPTWAGLEHSAGNRRLSAVMCMSSSRSTAKGRLVARSMAEDQWRIVAPCNPMRRRGVFGHICAKVTHALRELRSAQITLFAG